MKHMVSMLDFTPRELAGLIERAAQSKAGDSAALRRALSGRVLVAVFFNPSLRTRVSFELAMKRFGGDAVVLSVGRDAWKIETRDGVVMDGEASEHVREAAAVLSRYGDLLAVRSFARLHSEDEDARDEVVRSFARHASVPVVNMESAMEHPCQGLADWLTMCEQLGQTLERRFVLRWAPHVKPLPRAVPHSAVLAAAAAGMHVTIACPPGYELHPAILDRAATWCAAAGARLDVVHDPQPACREADVVYVKSWGAPRFYGEPDAQRADFERYRDWMLTRDDLGSQTKLMHCLPVRRNVVIADDALDDPRCVVADQAENRMWVQAAVLARLSEE